MILAKVIGTVVTTISHPHYDCQRLLVVQPLVSEGDRADDDFIAVDHTHAGIGDTVLINREGNGARQVLITGWLYYFSHCRDCGRGQN